MTLICEFSNNLYHLDNEYGPFLDHKSSGTITRRGINYDKVVEVQLDACASQLQCFSLHSLQMHLFYEKEKLPTCQIQTGHVIGTRCSDAIYGVY